MEKKLESEFTLIDWWKKVVIENYSTFTGRARRKEYWMFQLLNILIVLSFGIIYGLLIFLLGDDAILTYFPLIILGLYVKFHKVVDES